MRSRRMVTWGPLLVGLLALGCGDEGGADAGADTGSVGYVPPDPVPVTLPPEPDVSGLPLNEEGNPVVIDTGDVEISIDPSRRGPVSALAACMAVIERCWEEQGLNADNRITIMDVCARSAPTCSTDEPWNETACCPAACWERFEAGRRAGRDPHAVEREIYFGSDPCIPGVPPATGGGAP